MKMSASIKLAALVVAAAWLIPARAEKAESKAAAEPAQPAAPAEIKAAAQPIIPAPAAVNAPDTMLVKVDNQPITQAELDNELNQIQKMMKNRGLPPQQFEMMLKNIKPQILEGLVVRKLIARACEQEKVTVSPEEISKEIENFKASLPKKISLDDFLKQSGIARDAFERDVGEQLKVEKLLKITPPTEEEIKSYYEQNKAVHFAQPETVSARHILIAIDAADDQAKKKAKQKKADDLRAQLVKGADFEQLARENSDCPSKARGGKLGEFPRGQMVPAFEEVAFSIKTNEISKVVETDFGYHLIQTIDKNPARTVPLAEVKGQIAFRLKGKQVQEKIEALVKKLKESAKLEYSPAGEALKPLPLPEGGLPFLPPDDKGAQKGKSSKDSSNPKDSPKKSD